MDLTFHLIEGSELPYYQQLYLFIRHEIESGRMSGGTRLPSIRWLSESLKVSKTTIEDAYQQLLAEGYITSKPRAGYFSLPPEESLGDNTSLRLLNSKTVYQQAPKQIDIDFHPAKIDSTHFPKTIWRKLFNEVWKNADDTIAGYGDPQGETGLRHEIAKYLHHSRGVKCTPDQIVIGCGIQYSVQLLYYLLEEKVTSVAMEEPGYDKVQSIFERIGYKVWHIPIEKDGLNIELLRSSGTKLVYVTPSHQFPKGMVMPYTHRMQLLHWAKERKGMIIEDDYDGEFRYTERPVPSLQGLDNNESVVYMGTFSKSLTPSVRISYMVVPLSLQERLLTVLQTVDSPVSRVQQTVLEHFIQRGHWEKHIRRMRRIYREKHATLLEAIRSELGDRAIISGYGAGLHVSLALQCEFSELELIKRGETVGVRVYDLAQIRNHLENHVPIVYLGFGSLSHEQIREGIRRLNSVWF